LVTGKHSAAMSFVISCMPAKIGRRLQQTLSGSAADRGLPIALTRQATGCHHARTQAQRQGARALIDRRGGPRKLCRIQARSAVWLYDDHGRRKAATVELEDCVSQQGPHLDHILMLRPKPAKATATRGSAASAGSFRHRAPRHKVVG
jgi:hypothetical protein